MLKDISKKLTMKKSFFVTQLEGFFNSISQEYQALIHQKEVENSLLSEKVEKLEQDIANLVAIRHRLEEELEARDAQIRHLESRLSAPGNDAQYQKLLEENLALREQLKSGRSEEVERLKEQLRTLRTMLTQGAGGYRDALSEQQKEALVEEITKSLKK